MHLQVPREFVENIEPSQLADVVQKPQQQVQAQPAPEAAPAPEAPAGDLGA